MEQKLNSLLNLILDDRYNLREVTNEDGSFYSLQTSKEDMRRLIGRGGEGLQAFRRVCRMMAKGRLPIVIEEPYDKENRS